MATGLIQNHGLANGAKQIRASIVLPYEVIRIPIASDGFARSTDGETIARVRAKGDAVVFAIAGTHNTPRHIHEVLLRGKVIYRAG